jgi:hypothetical protein
VLEVHLCVVSTYFCFRSQCFLFAHDSKHSPQNDILVQLEKQIVALGGTPPFMDR